MRRSKLEEAASISRAGASILRSLGTAAKLIKPPTRSPGQRELRAALQPFADMLDIPGEPEWIRVKREWCTRAKEALEQS